MESFYLRPCTFRTIIILNWTALAIVLSGTVHQMGSFTPFALIIVVPAIEIQWKRPFPGL